MKASVPNLVGAREKGEKASSGKNRFVSLKRLRGFQENNREIRKFVIMVIYMVGEVFLSSSGP